MTPMSVPSEPRTPSPPPERGRLDREASREGVKAPRLNHANIVKVITVGFTLTLAILAAPADAAQAVDHAKSMLGSYECRDGSVSSVTPKYGAEDKTYSASKPYIQMTVASTAVGSSVEPR